MNQDIELMRNLLAWVSQAKRWELAYPAICQVSLNTDGSPHNISHMANATPTPPPGLQAYTVVEYLQLPKQWEPSLRLSYRDSLLWEGRTESAGLSGEGYSVSFEDGTTRHLRRQVQRLPAGFPLPCYWEGRTQFEVAYNLSQLDLAGLLRVRYFHPPIEWAYEPPLSMYLSPAGAQFIARTQDHSKWEKVKKTAYKTYNGAVPTITMLAQALGIASNAAQVL